jgi:pyrroloquinoline quinone biosynthesis protein B
MRIVVLGSAAGGGSPQWNCRCRVCDLAWQGDGRVPRRTQASLAISADDTSWCLVNCSPDVREQVAACKWLRPNGSPRGTPIGHIVLTNGDIDHVGGLLSLREGETFTIHATAEVLAILEENKVFDVLDRRRVARQPIAFGAPVRIGGGLLVELFPVPGKVPLYLESEAPETRLMSGHTAGARISSGGADLFYIPGCAHIDEELAGRLRGAAVALFDGTVWTDGEMIESGTGSKTGRRMGHMPVSGPDGSLAALEGLGLDRLIYTHINNTNPMLIAGSPERLEVERAGAEVAQDGMEIVL